MGPMFRYERPQSEGTSISSNGVETGADSPALDVGDALAWPY